MIGNLVLLGALTHRVPVVPEVSCDAVMYDSPASHMGWKETRRQRHERRCAWVPPKACWQLEYTTTLELQRAAWRVLSEQRRTPASPASAQWLEVWCDLEVGSTRAAVVGAMGEPSGEYTVSDGGEPQVYWAADQYDFRAYLDPVDGTVTDLLGDYDALSAADRSLLDCPELR